MSDPSPPAASASATPGRKPLKLTDLVLRAALVLLVGLLVLEVTSRRSYEASLGAISAAIARTEEQPEGANALTQDELAGLCQGLVRQRELYRGKSTFVEFTWPSLFKTYSIRVELDADRDVLGLETGEFDLADFSLTPPAPASRAKKTAQAEFPGLPDGHPPTVMLSLMLFRTRNQEGMLPDLIERELVRQAFLLAAREELGLPTRDAALGEIPPSRSEIRQFPFRIYVRKVAETVPAADNSQNYHSKLNVELGHWRQEEYDVLERFSLPITSAALESLVTECETLARTRFVKRLNESGYAGEQPPPSETEEPTGPPVESDELPGFEAIALYQELRRLHGMKSKPGHEPARLMSLARTYAHLGSATDYAFDLLPTVCQARALLYAERAVQMAQGAEALANRAYVRALVGRPKAALDDLEAAVTKDAGYQRPEWWSLIDAYCRGNVPEISSEEPADSLRRLKNHLELLLQQHSGTHQQQFHTAERVLADDPDNLLAQAVYSLHAPLGVGHQLYDAQFETSTQHWCETLRDVDGLPETAREAMRLPQKTLSEQALCRRMIIDKLREAAWLAAEDKEASWSVLADCLEEQTVFEAWSALNFYRFQLSVNADDVLQAMLPAVQGHYLERMIEAHCWNGRQAEAAWSGMSDAELELRCRASTLCIRDIPAMHSRTDRNYGRLVLAGKSSVPPLSGDLKAAYSASNARERGYLAAELAKVAPESPSMVEGQINSRWDQIRDEAGDWEQKYHDVAIVQSALAQQYLKDLNDEAAERCLRRVIELEPERSAYHSLADIFWRREDIAEWLKISEQALALPSQGLEQASSAQQIARTLMSRGLFQEALPYAERAAQSGSGWGMQCLADCYEGLSDWEQAEAYHRYASERYEATRATWYLWCRRTNRGDVEAARRLVAPLLSDKPGEADPLWRFFRATDEYLNDHPEQAYRLYREAGLGSGGSAHLHAALLAAELNMVKERDECLKIAVAKTRFDDRDFSQELALAIQTALQDPDWQPNEAVLDWLIQSGWGKGTPADDGFYIGKTLLLKGHQSKALRYLRLAATTKSVHQYAVLLAAHELHKLGEAAVPRRFADYPSDIAEALEWRDEAWTYSGIRARMRIDRALKLQPKLACLWESSAHLWFNEGNLDAALVDFNRAVELAPNIANIYDSRGVLRQRMGNDAEALNDFEKALELGSRAPQLHFELARIRSTSLVAELRDGKKALQHMEAIADSPLIDDWLKLSMKAAAHAINGDLEAAVQANQEAIDKALPSDRAKLEENQQRYEEWLRSESAKDAAGARP